MTSKLTKGPLFAEVHNVPDDYHFTEEELDCIIAGDMFTPRQGAIMARELQERRKAAMDSEPVILYRQVNPTNGMKTYWAELHPEEFRHLKQYADENAEFMTLYRHAQPALIPYAWSYDWACCVTCEGPQDFEPIIECEPPPQWAIDDGRVKNLITLYRHAQSAPVVQKVAAGDCPAFIKYDVTDVDEAWARGFNACRAAMLHGNHRDLSQPTDPQVAEYEQIMVQAGNCREIMETSTNSPVIGMNPADRSVEVRFIAPPGYLMVPDGDFYRLEHRSALLDEILQGKKSPSTKERLLEALFLKLKDDLGMPESAGMDDCEREMYRLRGIDEAYHHLQISPLSDGFEEWIALRDIDSHHNVPNDFREILKDALLATWRDSRKAALAVFKVANQEVSHERP